MRRVNVKRNFIAPKRAVAAALAGAAVVSALAANAFANPEEVKQRISGLVGEYPAAFVIGAVVISILLFNLFTKGKRGGGSGCGTGCSGDSGCGGYGGD